MPLLITKTYVIQEGVVTNVSEEGICVSVPHRSGVNWKWPKPIDAICYLESEIIQKIAEPIAGRRGTLRVPEMDLLKV